jgi:hypothetical protein
MADATKVPRWSDELVSDVYGLKYDFEELMGKLYLPSGCACDMGGCINLFKRIDPNVLWIRTYSGIQPDTVYRCEYGEWKAYEQRPNRKEKVS